MLAWGSLRLAPIIEINRCTSCALSFSSGWKTSKQDWINSLVVTTLPNNCRWGEEPHICCNKTSASPGVQGVGIRGYDYVYVCVRARVQKYLYVCVHGLHVIVCTFVTCMYEQSEVCKLNKEYTSITNRLDLL